MTLMLASCKPHPNWKPINPKLMLKICQKLKRGFCICSPPSGAADKQFSCRLCRPMCGRSATVYDLPARTSNCGFAQKVNKRVGAAVSGPEADRPKIQSENCRL